MTTGALGLILAFLVVGCTKMICLRITSPAKPPRWGVIIVAVTSEHAMRQRRPAINLKVKRRI